MFKYRIPKRKLLKNIPKSKTTHFNRFKSSASTSLNWSSWIEKEPVWRGNVSQNNSLTTTYFRFMDVPENDAWIKDLMTIRFSFKLTEFRFHASPELRLPSVHYTFFLSIIRIFSLSRRNDENFSLARLDSSIKKSKEWILERKLWIFMCVKIFLKFSDEPGILYSVNILQLIKILPAVA